MAERRSTPMNDLADSIVAKLSRISAKKDNSYLSNPVMPVTRLNAIGNFAGKAKPCLALTVLGWEVEPQAGSRFEGTFRFGVHCMTENNAKAEAALLDLVSDVILALQKDVTVGSQAIYLFPRSFEPNLDLSGRTGLAVTTVEYECKYKFDATAP